MLEFAGMCKMAVILGHCSQRAFTLLFETEVLTSLELAKQARLGAPGSCLSLPPQCRDYKHVPPCPAF